MAELVNLSDFCYHQSMNPQELFETLLSRFEQESNPQNALSMAAYMKNHFEFYGIATPQRRKLYKDIIATDKKAKTVNWPLLDLAWEQPKREWHYFVCDYLKALNTHLTLADLPKLMHYATSQQWWDTIDQLDQVFGNITDAGMKEVLLELSTSDDFWLRRIAIDHQLGKKELTDTILLEQIIINNLGSKEFFINKAIGWSLREYSKTNPDWVRSFIQKHQLKMAPLSIKEASKYL